MGSGILLSLFRLVGKQTFLKSRQQYSTDPNTIQCNRQFPSVLCDTKSEWSCYALGWFDLSLFLHFYLFIFLGWAKGNLFSKMDLNTAQYLIHLNVTANSHKCCVTPSVSVDVDDFHVISSYRREWGQGNLPMLSFLDELPHSGLYSSWRKYVSTACYSYYHSRCELCTEKISFYFIPTIENQW
jgi:hypothetical protein